MLARDVRATAKTVPANILLIVFFQALRLICELLLLGYLLLLYFRVIIFDVLQIGLVQLGKVHSFDMVHFLEVVVRFVEEDGCLLVMHLIVAHQVLAVLTIFELAGLLGAESFRVFLI